MKTLKKPKNKILRILFLILGIALLTLAVGVLILGSIAPYLARKSQNRAFADVIDADSTFDYSMTFDNPVFYNGAWVYETPKVYLLDFPYPVNSVSDDVSSVADHNLKVYGVEGFITPPSSTGLPAGCYIKFEPVVDDGYPYSDGITPKLDTVLDNPHYSAFSTIRGYFAKFSNSVANVTVGNSNGGVPYTWSVKWSGSSTTSTGLPLLGGSWLVFNAVESDGYAGLVITLSFPYLGILYPVYYPSWWYSSVDVVQDFYYIPVGIGSMTTIPLTELNSPLKTNFADFGYFNASYGGGGVDPERYEITYQQSITNPVSYFVKPVADFLNTPFFGTFSFGTILGTLLCVVVAVIFLKLFAGG